MTAVHTAVSSSFAVLNDGTLWSWGGNDSGQLGTGNTSGRAAPGQVTGIDGVAAVRTGGAHVLAILGDGTLRAWGANSSGQLGDGTTTQRTSPVIVPGLSNVIAVAAGAAHSVALVADGSVWIWGNNSYGQLGDGTTTSRSTPTPVTGLPPIVAISANANHTFAMAQDGSLWAWGRNNEGQLGDGTTTNRNRPVMVANAGMAWSVPTPMLSLASGLYTGEQNVTVSNAEPSVVMHYTLNGVDPAESDPVVASGSVIPITQSLTLKVRAWRPADGSQSAVGVGMYELRVAAPTFSPTGGQYTSAQTVALNTVTANAVIRYTTDGTTPNASSPVYTSPILVPTTTTLRAVGNWTTASGFVPLGLLADGLEHVQLPNWSVENLRVTWTDGDSALLLYVRKGADVSGEQSPQMMLASTLWTKRDGKWLAVHHQETALAQQ